MMHAVLQHHAFVAATLMRQLQLRHRLAPQRLVALGEPSAILLHRTLGHLRSFVLDSSSETSSRIASVFRTLPGRSS